MVTEVIIIVKNAEKTNRTKHLDYNPVTLSMDNESLKECVDSAVKDFGQEPDDIIVKATIVIK